MLLSFPKWDLDADQKVYRISYGMFRNEFHGVQALRLSQSPHYRKQLLECTGLALCHTPSVQDSNRPQVGT